MQAPARTTAPLSLIMWTVGTTAGWAFGLLPAMLAITGAGCCNGDGAGAVQAGYTRLCLIVFFVFLGCVIVSGGQAGAMQRILAPNENRWLWQSAVSMFLGWIFGWIASIPVFDTVKTNAVANWVLSGAIIGAVVGFLTAFFQLLVLNRLRIARLWWVGVTMIGWICASALYWLVYAAAGGPFHATYTYYEGGFWPKSAEAPGALPAMVLAWLAGGLVLSLITGGGMLALLRAARPNSVITNPEPGISRRDTNAVSD